MTHAETISANPLRPMKARTALVLLEALLWLLGVKVALLLRGKRPVINWARQLSRGGRAGAEAVPEAVLLGRAVEATANRLPGRFLCLERALALKALAWRRSLGGIRLHIGLAKDESGSVIGHAWTTVEETIVTGKKGVSGFTVMETIE